MHDKVSRLRQIMREAIPAQSSPSGLPKSEAAANDAFAYFEANAPQPIVVDQTPEARAIREIMRIANWYGWPGEVTRALDAAGAVSLHSLESSQLQKLLARMRTLEECVQNGGESPDAPPAR